MGSYRGRLRNIWFKELGVMFIFDDFIIKPLNVPLLCVPHLLGRNTKMEDPTPPSSLFQGQDNLTLVTN